MWPRRRIVGVVLGGRLAVCLWVRVAIGPDSLCRHGQYYDLLRIFDKIGGPEVQPQPFASRIIFRPAVLLSANLQSIWACPFRDGIKFQSLK